MDELQQLSPEQRQSLKSRGLAMGAKVGFVLSVTYATLAVCYILSSQTGTRSTSSAAEKVFGFVFILVIAWIWGAVPGTAIGLLTGGLIGTMLGKARYPASNGSAAWDGLFIALLAVALVHVLGLGGGFGEPRYTIFWGVPSIIYLIASVWGAIWLKNTVRTIPEGEAGAASLPPESNIVT